MIPEGVRFAAAAHVFQMEPQPYDRARLTITS